ncbi:MAG: iron-sulfur cluster assembly scaffold protein [Coriobacteriales bacterium]|jgi:NifU-like protein involved in Fe-S cluster formation|nr:iron-sulfur cluster assembly scaffold protein [Coriobacteriales bacterium]
MERNVYKEIEDRLIIRTAHIKQTQLEVGVDSYSPAVAQIVATADNAGPPADYNCLAMIGSSKRGTISLRLFARADYENARFLAVGFQAQGCLALIAAASMAAHLCENRSWKQALSIRVDDLMAVLGSLPNDKRHVPFFAVEAIRALVGDCLVHADQSRAFIEDYVGCDDTMLECMLCEHCSLRTLRNQLRYLEMQSAQAVKTA